MSYILSKKFKFEAAHRLAKGYVGKCANIHGHSWYVTVQLSCHNLNQQDMGIDYAEINTFNESIRKEFDHKLLLCKDDTTLLSVCKKENYEVVTFDENPTSETIAKTVYDKAKGYFSSYKNIDMHQVIVEETCTSACYYKP
ncbi:hypothetical protein DID77_02530 [Candidatus Marinamargulisbacteria bacterium SCGC AG-439-L15]|nr:hypothetical protein DID77_02530 [Candidatus Marinamargulisbacteria bacterium SCGC AG-439-L15]